MSNYTAFVNISGWIIFAYCVFYFFRMLLKNGFVESTAQGVTKHSKPLSWVLTVVYVGIFFFAVFASTMTLLNPQRMANYLNTVFGNLKTDIKRY